MSKITVYQFNIYDITTDYTRTSTRWGTREGIERVCGKLIEDTAQEVDASFIGHEVEGLTERDFNPNPRTGFQQKVD